MKMPQTVPTLLLRLIAACLLLLGSVSQLLAADYATTVNSFSPLAYWRFNETTVSPPLNIIANSGSLGSLADGAVVQDVTKGAAGIVGSALRINNPGAAVGIVPARVDVPYSAGLNPSSFSVEFWAKPNALGPDTTGSCILTSLNGNGFSGGNRSGWVIYLSDTGLWRFWLGLTAGYAGQATAAGPAAVGNWYHVVCTYDGLTMRIYVNGVQAGSLASNAGTTGWRPQDQALLRIGGTELTGTLGPTGSRPSVSATSHSGNRGYEGWLDETAVYATALTPSQVAAHYSAATTNTAGYGAQILADSPVAYWRMEEPAVTPPSPSSFPIAVNSGSVGSAADGTNTWGALANQDGAAYAGFGAGNKAVFFDGANGSVALPDAAGLHFSGNITMMAWVKPTQKDYFRNILSHGLDDARGETFLRISRSDDGGGGGTTTNYYEVGVANGVPAGFNLIYPGGTANYYHAARFPIPSGDIGNWVFVAGTYDGANWNLYRNGKLVASLASPNGAYDVTNRWAIGSRLDPLLLNPAVDTRFFTAAGMRFAGSIDEPAIFNTALSAANIDAIYNAAVVPPVISRAVAVPTGVFKGSSAPFNVWAEGSPTLTYLWYSNGISTGVTATNLTLNNLQAGNLTVEAVATNPYGAATSSVTFLVVASKPLITQQPVPVARYVGRPFSFSVAAGGTTPISYQWQTNGVDIPGATSATYAGTASFANAFNYSCILSNEAGTSNSVSAALTVVAAPSGAYGAAVFSDNPVAYWRLGETSGTTAYDYYGGNNGTYFATALNQAGYSELDPDKAAAFNGVNSYAGQINGNPATGGINFEGHVNFSVEAWVNGPAGMTPEASIIAKGAGNSGTSATEQFALDVATSGTGDLVYRFFTRGGGDSLFQAFADVGPNGSWDHVVGVYDDLNVLGGGSLMYIFVNGELRGTGAPRAIGLRPSSVPVSIGSKRLGNAPNYDGTFNGLVDEAAIYSYALTANQISNHYAMAYGTTTKPTITRQPVSLTVYESSPTPPKFEVGAFGSQPITYQWKKGGVDLVDGGNILGANTRALTIDPVTSADAGNYSVTVNNAVGPATNSVTVTLSVIPAPTNAPNVPGLVLHMPFDNSLNDTSGRGNHGTGRRANSVIGSFTNLTAASPAPSNPDFFYPTDGRLGQALHYRTGTENGGNGAVTNSYYVTLGDKPDLRFSTNVNFSVAYWFRFPPFNGVGDLGDLPAISTALTSYGAAGYTFAPSYNLGSWSYSLNGNVQLYGEDYLLDDGNWHHIAHTFDRNGTAVSYVDGKQKDVRSMSAAGNLDTGNAVTIGQTPTGLYPEEGYYDIDDVGIWRRALSPLEVVGIYLAATLANSSFVDITPSIAAGPGANQVTITWQAGTLQSSTSVNGPFTDVLSAVSPYTDTAVGVKYYRTRY